MYSSPCHITNKTCQSKLIHSHVQATIPKGRFMLKFCQLSSNQARAWTKKATLQPAVTAKSSYADTALPTAELSCQLMLFREVEQQC